MDYEALGLKVGLEIHQQLDTRKLFCRCPSLLSDEVRGAFVRRLRPTQSELGEVDRAAVEEAAKKLLFRYEATPNSCLVEADEEPPHPLNEEALDIALSLALLLDAKPFDEVHVMRKIVIDGSNTAGFQRTALVAADGGLDVDGKRIGIPTILVEEDAARQMGVQGGEAVYRLDRLGIPLIEVSTTPNIASPAEAARVAARLGALLRATKKVRRGLGTIREDLNVSVRGGARIEIKGVQELGMIPVHVEKEVERQTMLLDAAAELRRRRAAVDGVVHDLTSVLQGTESKLVRSATRAGGRVLGIALKGFGGLLREKLGPEFAGRAAAAGVGGILHADELPGYGITEREVSDLRSALALDAEDAFVLVAAEESIAREALRRVVDRSGEALAGVPEETRDPLPDGTTTYSRPLPGQARMYPETDIPPVRIPPQRIETLRTALPELPEKRAARFVEAYGVHEQVARQLVDDGMDDAFEEVAAVEGKDVARAAATLFTNAFPELRREGFDVDALSTATLLELFGRLREGAFAKEALPDLVRRMVKGRVGVDAAAEALGLTAAVDVEAIVAEVVEARRDFVRSKGMAAVGPLMGAVMERVRGKVDGQQVSQALTRRVKEVLEAEG